MFFLFLYPNLALGALMSFGFVNNCYSFTKRSYTVSMNVSTTCSIYVPACNPSHAIVENGRVKIEERSYREGDVIPVACDTDYVMLSEHSSGLTCSVNGTWLPSAKCVRRCKYRYFMTEDTVL